MAGGSALDEHRSAIADAVSALRALPTDLWRAGGVGLGELAGEIGGLHQACEAATVAVVREAVERGEPRRDERALTPVQWLRLHAPTWRAGGAAQVVAVAEAFAVPGNSPVKAAVQGGILPVRSAAVVVAEADRLRPLLADGAEEAVVAGMVEVTAQHGPGACRQLRSAMLARYGRDGVLQCEQDAAKRFVALSRPRVDPLGLAEYRLTLDPEGRAVLEAALGPLSAPRPTEGERDLRSGERRRGEALVSLVRRAVAAGDQVGPHAKTTLLVQVPLETLRSGVAGAAETVAGSDAGVHLAPETARRLACDAQVVPVVLDGVAEVADLGRARRLFTGGQTRRMWLRDRHCTYPGCDLPAQWTDAHHLVHWADGGATDLSNAALLCERHHTVVHQRRLAGEVVADGEGRRVEWDLTVGSYDLRLARLAAREPA